MDKRQDFCQGLYIFPLKDRNIIEMQLSEMNILFLPGPVNLHGSLNLPLESHWQSEVLNTHSFKYSAILRQFNIHVLTVDW